MSNPACARIQTVWLLMDWTWPGAKATAAWLDGLAVGTEGLVVAAAVI